MHDETDWRDGAVQRTLPDGIGLEWSRARGRRHPRRRVPWVLLLVVAAIVIGVVLWLENRGQVHLSFLSIHLTAPLWVVAVANLVLGLVLGALLATRSRR
jgi:uncharacterized integral membrane protein